MRKLLSAVTACLSLCLVLTLQGCLKDKVNYTYKIYTPVYKTLTEVRADMKSCAAQLLQNTGKIYLYGNYIFVNEQNKGIHVIDNTNPSLPKNIGFIQIPGNMDIAIKDNYLFADSYSDIAVLDISNPINAKPVKFLDNVIKDRDHYWYSNPTNPDSVFVLVDFVAIDTTVDYATYNRWTNCPNCMYETAGGRGGGVFYASAPVAKTGTSGSMARFNIVKDYLYAVSGSQLYSINISDPALPQQTATKNLNWTIETIYPFQNKLFIGSRLGMFIFDLTNPGNPVQQGQFTHARSCDPVVADNNYAYVTLRSGTTCNSTINQLDIVDISNLAAPVLQKTYNLVNPSGLSKDGNKLFICDGKDGLKLYDATDVNNLKLISHFRGMEAYDVIVINGRAILIAKDGLYQYDYSGSSVQLLSKISTSN